MGGWGRPRPPTSLRVRLHVGSVSRQGPTTGQCVVHLVICARAMRLLVHAEVVGRAGWASRVVAEADSALLILVFALCREVLSTIRLRDWYGFVVPMYYR